MGRNSVFIISGAMVCQLFGIVCVYYIVFADTMSLLASQILTGNSITSVLPAEEVKAQLSQRSPLAQIFAKKMTYVLLSACMLAPVLFKRKLAEIKVFSYLLFASVIAFIFLTALDLWETRDQINPSFDLGILVSLKPGFGLITSMSIISVAFFYHVLVFPAYSALQNRSTQRFGCATVMTNSICAFIYLCLGIICLFLFGDQIQSNVIRNMATRPGLPSFGLRAIFCVLLLMHIPYIFHPLKEAVLVFNLEYNSRAISDRLEEKIREARQKKYDLLDREETRPFKNNLDVNVN
jgi:amino acid permease